MTKDPFNISKAQQAVLTPEQLRALDIRPTGVQEAVDLVFRRWGSLSRPMMDREQCGKVLAISLALGALFNENAEAEKDWMQTPRREFRSRPITMVNAGHIDAVLDLVMQECNPPTT